MAPHAVTASGSNREGQFMIRSISLLIALSTGVQVAGAQDIGDAQAGLKLSREVCSSCHAVEAGETQSPNNRAPNFQRIANVPGMTPTALTVALRTSHRTMPNLTFEQEELEDLIAYITSLQGSR
jgi:mono/diheme cytochrome c family protein